MPKFLEADLTFHNDKITFIGNPFEGDDNVADIPEQELEVMMGWETSIMERSAEFVCENGGDILEIGFGMGIASGFIQSHNPTSHTIIELHPQIAEKATLWAADKTNVTLIEGDWLEILPTLSKFDGIFYDAFGFAGHWNKVAEMIKDHTRSGCRVTFWNCCRDGRNGCGFDDSYNITYEQIEVDPPQNTYFNDKVYFLPKVVM
jgi:hypothetical protein